MGSTANIIIISSPENYAIHTPPPAVVGSKSTLLCDAPSSATMTSLSELFRPPSRSRFFATPDHDRSKTQSGTAKDAPIENRTTTDLNVAPLGNKPARKGRKVKARVQTELGDGDQQLKQNAASKPKRTTKKQADTGNRAEKLKNKTLTGKVAKAGTAKSKTLVSKPVDGYLPKPSRELSVGKEDAYNYAGDDLLLEPAMKRRLDWTPTKKPTQLFLELEGEDGAIGGGSGLGTILSGFEYDGANTALDKFQVLADDGPTKRRRIELVDSRFLPLKPNVSDNNPHSNIEEGPQMSAAVKPTKKSKPRAKRLTTLTARVTASYQLDFTDQENSVAVEALAAVKTKSRKTKKKTEGASGFKVPRTILLSPEAAVKSLDQQDLVFGTCSQLERADSPTLLKDTQIAIQESEKESLSAPTSHSNHYPRLTGPSAALTRLAAPRNLWSVAARDIEGLLVDVEVIDLVDTPEGPRFTALTHDEDRKEDTETGEVKPVKNESSISRVETLALDDASTDEKLPVAAIKPVTQPSPSKPKASTNRRMPSYENWKDTSLAREIKKNGLKAMKNRKKIVEVLKECWIAKNGLSNQGQDLKVAQDKEPTSALNQLLKVEKIKKPRVATQETSKSKSTAPQAVEAICEDSTATAISTSSTSTVSTANESQPPTSRSQEQPHIEFTLTPLVKSTPIKPEPTKSYMDIEEIQDSEDELLPSPSRLFDFFLRPEKKQELPTSPLPSSPSLKPPSTPRNDLKRQQTQEHLPTIPASVTTPSSKLKLPKLNDQITKAVRAQPRLHTSGLKRGLTWHEKILMYDPIYLEDFTAWLNTEGLSLVDEDREVGAGVVRDWCESKGICCCYKTRKPGRHY